MNMPNANPTLAYPTRTIFHWLALGLTFGIIGSRWPSLTHTGHYWLELGVALGLQGFLDSNMLVSATQKSRIGGIALHEPPMRGGFAL